MLRFLFKNQAAASRHFLSGSEALKKSFSSGSNNSVLLNTLQWEKMSFIERINVAMANNEPQIAEIAYYKGLGFKKMGLSFSNEAIEAFNKAIELDESYQASSEKEIANIYKDLGSSDQAFDFMSKAFTHMIKDESSFQKTKKLFSDLEAPEAGKRLKLTQ